MAVSAVITPGKIFTDGEAITVSELNKLGAPTVDISGAVGSLSLADGSVTNAKVAAGTGVQLDKLETGTDAQVIVANSSGEGVWVAVSGDATVDNAGAVTIAAGAVESSMLAAGVAIPAGCITQYGGSAAPSGWFICDGSVKNSDTDTTLAALYTAIGFTYGGTGSDAFNLPNLQGRVPVGKDSGSFPTLGQTGGDQEVTLTESQMPVHNHDITLTQSTNTFVGPRTLGNAGSITNSFTSDNTGGGLPHNNVQPYLVVNYIIKT